MGASPFSQTMPFKSEVVVDCHGHLLGRLASTVAKELLSGQKIVLVRCELLNISGELFRNQLKWESFARKRTATNPKKGPFHYRSPADLLKRTIRGMVPHKTARDAPSSQPQIHSAQGSVQQRWMEVRRGRGTSREEACCPGGRWRVCQLNRATYFFFGFRHQIRIN